MVASTDIKFYVHTNTNAPQLTNNFGCMIDVLDACLVNGFGSQAVATLTASGTTVTATYGSAHNYLQYQVTKIAGVNQTEFNGEHRILTVPDANTITFELAAVPSVTTATGTITSSLPSLGWEKPFSSTHSSGVGGKAAYRSTNLLLSSRPFLRVVDELDPAYTATYAKYAKVGIVEDMVGIDTMLGVQAPYDSANPNKNWVGTGSGAPAYNGWAKWYYARNAAVNSSVSDTSATVGVRSWLIVGNSDYFYILPAFIPSNVISFPYGFGCFKSFLTADNSNTFLASHYIYMAAHSVLYAMEGNSHIGVSGTNNLNLLLQRSYNQVAQSTTANIRSLVASSAVNSGVSNYIGAYSLTNIAALIPAFINESVLRGELPNLYYLFQLRPYSNLQTFAKDGQIFIAKNIATSGSEGQIVLKIGEL